MKRRFCGFRNCNFDSILHLRHKYTLFILADGNFKKDDSDDVSLNEGRSYFVESTSFKSYLTAVEVPMEVCYCNLVSSGLIIGWYDYDPLQNGIYAHLRANRLQNVIIVCARHGFYLPHGMVDLTKGDAWAFWLHRQILYSLTLITAPQTQIMHLLTLLAAQMICLVMTSAVSSRFCPHAGERGKAARRLWISCKVDEQY